MRLFQRFFLPFILSLLPFILALMVSSAFAQSASTPAVTYRVPVTITAGDTFQTILPALKSPTPRKSLTIENNNTNSDSCWLFLGSMTATKATSILLLPGGSYTRYFPYVPSDEIQATCTSTSDTLYVDYQ